MSLPSGMKSIRVFDRPFDPVLSVSCLSGQRDGAVLLATFSAPVAVLETPSGILVLEDPPSGLTSRWRASTGEGDRCAKGRWRS